MKMLDAFAPASNRVDNTEEQEDVTQEKNRVGDIPIKHLENPTVKQSPEIYRCKNRFQEKLIS